MSMIRGVTSAVAGLILSSLSACGGGGGGSSTPPPPPPTNAAPTFGALTFTATEDTDLTGHAGATDPEGAAITITATTNPAHGALVSLSATNGDFVYRPAANYFGADSFNVRVQDPAGNAGTGTVTITVAAVNDAPQIQAPALSTNEDTSVTGSVTSSDVEGGTLTVSRLSEPANGTLSSFNANGAFTYQPNPGFAGNDTFQVRVTDSGGATADAAVNVVVNRVSAVYTGATTAVTVAETNAPTAARSAWLALELAALTSDESPGTAFAGGVIDRTTNGTDSGSVRYTGTLAANGTGRLTANYTQFTQDGLILDGRVLIDILDPRTATTGRVRFSPRGLRLRDGRFDGTLTGALIRTDSQPGGVDTRTVTGELLAIEPSGVQHWFTGIALANIATDVVQREPGSGGQSTFQWTGAARAYDSRYGYLDVTIDPHFAFLRNDPGNGQPMRSDVNRAYGHGSLVASGTGTGKVWLTPLSPAAFTLEINRNGGATPDCSLAFRWEDDFGQPAGADTGSLVLAAAAMPMEYVFPLNGEAYLPEGRFSQQSQGKFLTHQWSIAVAPAGSGATIASANTPRPVFTADVSGEYLLKLVVSDGTHLSTDYVRFESTSGTQPALRGQTFPMSRGIPGAVPILALQEEFTFDGRRSYLNYFNMDIGLFGLGPVGWEIQRFDPATNWQTVVSQTPGMLLTFAPTQPGLYNASFSPQSGSSAPVVSMSFAVGPQQPRLSPQVFFELGYLMADYDGDGDVDLLGTSGDVFSGMYLTVSRRNGAGRFDAAQALGGPNLSPSGSIGRVRFDDFSGDGKADVVVTNGVVVQAAIQQPNGTLAAPVTLTGPTCQAAPSTTYYLGAVDVNRDGRSDVVRGAVCDNSSPILFYNASNANGTFGAATVIATTSEQNMTVATSADIDGDGDRELIGPPYISASTTQAVQILSLTNAGTFATTTIPVSHPYFAHENTFRVLDVNSDGRLDIVGGDNPVYVLTQNPAGTFTERASLPALNSTSANWNAIPAGDVDGDGRIDLFLSGTLYRQLPDGGFLALENVLTPGDNLLDIDLDGRADFLGSNGPGNAFVDSVFLSAPPQ